MRNTTFWLGTLLFIVCCTSKKPEQLSSRETTDYPMVSYLEVAKIVEGLGGPYVLDLKNKNGMQIVLVGCPHSRDTAAKEFELIEIYFKHLKPQVGFNEGGEIPKERQYPSRNASILQNGESGLLKYLCDKEGIEMLNGDIGEQEEFNMMLDRFPKHELLLYYAFERFIVPMHYTDWSDEALAREYPNFIQYMRKNGFPITDQEADFNFFKNLYKREMNKSFDTQNADIEQFDFLNDNCKYCALGRESKVVRDKVLIRKVEQALDKYDRIFITFGGAHAIAIEPALKALLKAKEVNK
jgi:hypothetical protein